MNLPERENMSFLFVQKQRVLFLTEVFKIYNKQGPLYFHDMFLPVFLMFFKASLYQLQSCTAQVFYFYVWLK